MESKYSRFSKSELRDVVVLFLGVVLAIVTG